MVSSPGHLRMSREEAGFLLCKHEVGDGQNINLRKGSRVHLYFSFSVRLILVVKGSKLPWLLPNNIRRGGLYFPAPSGCPGHEAALGTNMSFPEIEPTIYLSINNTRKGLL